MNRSLRKVATSQAVGKISKDRILQIALAVSRKLPSIPSLNKRLDIQWSGQFALDAVFVKLQGKTRAILLCSDFHSLDLVDYLIAELENYYSWAHFLRLLHPTLAPNNLTKFFVTDGKKGLHQALTELFPKIPTQLCTSHKQRRINQLAPRIHGDGYDKLFCHLAHRAITAPQSEIADVYVSILTAFKNSGGYQSYPETRQKKLKNILGALRFQKSKLYTRYSCPYPIDDTTTNHLEGINSFFKERLNLMKGFKKSKNAILLIKLLIYYYRFHKFTSSHCKQRNGKCPVELNEMQNRQLLDKILQGNQPCSWIKNLLSGT